MRRLLASRIPACKDDGLARHANESEAVGGILKGLMAKNRHSSSFHRMSNMAIFRQLRENPVNRVNRLHLDLRLTNEED
jgi:hypothetical protein